MISHSFLRGAATLSLALLTASAASAESGRAYKVCRLDPNGDNFLALRSGPGSSHGMVMTLDSGSVVESRGTMQGKWLLVVVEHSNGTTFLRDLPTGYVYGDYLCPLR